VTAIRLVRSGLPLFIALVSGWLALLGLLFLPDLASLLTGWATFLAAIALILGVINLAAVHGRRLAQANLYSAVLLLGMFSVIGLAVADWQGLTRNGVDAVFELVLRPLEAALASLLAFFLLFAGYRLLRRQRSGWTVLFLVAVLLFLLASLPLSVVFAGPLAWVQDYVRPLFVDAGVRALLIGVALGVLTLGLRLLAGAERPYNK
jgi:hypothetical protein